MFIANSDFAIGQQLIIFHILYEGERVLIMGWMVPQLVQNTNSTVH